MKYDDANTANDDENDTDGKANVGADVATDVVNDEDDDNEYVDEEASVKEWISIINGQD